VIFAEAAITLEDAVPYVAAAYAIVWLVTVLYVWLLHGKLRRLEGDLAAAEEQLAARRELDEPPRERAEPPAPVGL
jgi:CcmD family protein